jgi:hypothetical protein
MAHSIFRSLLGAGGGLVGSGCGVVLPTVWDDNFDCGSSLDTSGGRFSGAKAWTLSNPPSATWAYSGGNLVVTCQNLTQNVSLSRMSPLPAGDWTFLTKVSTTGTGLFSGAYLWLLEAATGKQLHHGIGNDFGYKYQIRRFSDASTWYANYGGAAATLGVVVWLEISRSGSNLIFRHSLDGAAWTTVITVAQTVDFTTAPDEIGLSVWEQASGAAQVATFDFFQKTA